MVESDFDRTRKIYSTVILACGQSILEPVARNVEVVLDIIPQAFLILNAELRCASANLPKIDLGIPHLEREPEPRLLDYRQRLPVFARSPYNSARLQRSAGKARFLQAEIADALQAEQNVCEGLYFFLAAALLTTDFRPGIIIDKWFKY